ncbi:hypothetical protein KEJ23_01015 [Candidatus Bathyarchaeota archaeon]|nr:hypothetical protein [Candidatus Bathyarchaeota archaeon]
MSIGKRIFSLFIIVLVLTVCVSPILGLQENQDRTRARIFMEVAEKARSIAVELIDRARASGEDMAVRVRLIDEGNELLSKTREAYDKGEYDKAAADARLAQFKYREAMRGLGPISPLVDGNIRVRLIEAIQRARTRIARVRDALRESMGVSEALRGEISGKLDEAERILNEAESAIRSSVESASEAARKLAQAERTLSEAFTLLKKAPQEPNRRRVEASLRRLEQEILRLRTWVERLERRGVRVERLGEIQNLLEKAENLVHGAKLKVDGGDLAGALADMMEAEATIKRTLNLIRGQAFK